MSAPTDRIAAGRLRALPAIAVLVLAAAAHPGSGVQAQAVSPVIPPGYVLVDDMILPGAAVYGESAFTATAWPNGIVPFAFDANVTSANQTRALTAMAEWEAVADVDFVPRTTETNHIVVTDSTGNSSFVGMIGGAQPVNISSWTTKYVICHELNHALGFIHEQSRPDRNTFVTINTANIQSGTGHNFDIESGATTVGAYDFLSIMHYGQFFFSSNGQPTITCNAGFTGFQSQIGNRTFMTVLDAQGVANRYGAPSSPDITGLSPGFAVAGSAALTLVVTGERFFQGSPNGSGVQGSRVQWNGTDLPTTFVDPQTLQATVSTALLSSATCASVRVNNAAPGGGLSAAAQFSVVAGTSLPTQVWTGSAAGDEMGRRVVGVGDVNGDGRPDVCVSAPGWDGDRGRVIWCDGATGAVLRYSNGGSPGDRLGSALAPAGDVNGDGTQDLLIGVPGYDNDRGLAIVESGAGVASPLHFYFGTNAGDAFGAAVADAGDVNGDGTPDQVIGAPGYNSGTGRVLVKNGASGATIQTLNGSATGDRFGTSVCGGFDLISGGSPPKVAVGAPHYDGQGTSSGRVNLYFAQTGSLAASFYGDGADDLFGSSLAMAPSIDGRAGGCLIVGAPETGGFTINPAGYVRVFGPFDQSVATHPEIVTWNGAAGDRFGTAVSGAGDIDQDGIEDIVVGAPSFSPGNPLPGYIRIYSGRTRVALHTRSGSDPLSLFGFSVAAAGDFDADGRPDVIAGAPWYDALCGDVGQARIVSMPVAPEPRKVMITEVSWGIPDGCEITNFSTSAVDLTGWKVRWKDGSIYLALPLPVTIAPGESFVVLELPVTTAFPETPAGIQVLHTLPSIPTTAGDITVGLVNASGVVVDEVRITDTAGIHAEGSVGGSFRGVAVRGVISHPLGASGCVERIWGLDSNSGADWTEEVQTSMGLENRSSGPRGTDPLPVASVVINEIDDSPDLVELRNVGASAVDLAGWYLMCSALQNQVHAVVRPWPATSTIAAGGFSVAGEGAAPAELPAGVPYVDILTLGSQNIPWTSEELDCALYDDHGRLVDLLRTTGHDDVRVHNQPRAPSHWADFTGAGGRSNNSGDQAQGRNNASTDTNTGADWYPFYTRTMGSSNASAGQIALPGHGHGLDVRVNDSGLHGGLTMIINAGAAHAGERWSFLFGAGHQNGQGLFFGLGFDALTNYFAIYNVPPWFGFLDARGSARLDVPPFSVPAGIQTDDLFILQNAAGAVTLMTRVLEWDTL